MTTIERRGKQITLVIAALSALPAASALFNLLFFGRRLSASDWVWHFVWLLMVSVPLFRGTAAVRMFASFVYGLLATTTGFLAVLAGTTLGSGELAFRWLIASTCLAAAVVLWRSTAVQAYFARQDRGAPA